MHRFTSSLAAALAALALATPAAAQTWAARADTAASGFHPSAASGSGGSSVVLWYVAGRVRAAAFAPDGELAGTWELASLDGSDVRVLGSAFLPSGDLVLLGDVDEKPWLACVDPSTGVTLWDHTASNFRGSLRSVTVLENGRLLVCGQVETDILEPETLAVLLEADGDLVWHRRYSDADGYDWGYDVAPADGGGAWLVGYTYGALRVTRIGSGPSMPTVWQQELSADEGLYETRACATSDGGLVLAGLTEPEEDVYRMFAMKLAGNGDVEWCNGYQSHDLDIFEAGLPAVGDVVELPDGGYAISFSQPVPGPPANLDVAVLRLGTQGNPLSYRNLSTSTARERALSIAHVGGTYVVGSFVDGAGPRVVRVAASGDSGLACLPGHPMSVFADPLNPAVQPTTGEFLPVSTLASAEHTSPLPFAVSGGPDCANLCEVRTFGFGSGLPGTGGIAPRITGQNGYCVGAGPELRVADALGGSVGFFGFSNGTAALPVLGGFLWIDPAGLFTQAFTLDGPSGAAGAGETTLPVTTNLMPLAGTELYAQAFVLDPAAPFGISLTGGLTIDID